MSSGSVGGANPQSVVMTVAPTSQEKISVQSGASKGEILVNIYGEKGEIVGTEAFTVTRDTALLDQDEISNLATVFKNTIEVAIKSRSGGKPLSQLSAKDITSALKDPTTIKVEQTGKILSGEQTIGELDAPEVKKYKFVSDLHKEVEATAKMSHPSAFLSALQAFVGKATVRDGKGQYKYICLRSSYDKLQKTLKGLNPDVTVDKLQKTLKGLNPDVTVKEAIEKQLGLLEKTMEKAPPESILAAKPVGTTTASTPVAKSPATTTGAAASSSSVTKSSVTGPGVARTDFRSLIDQRVAELEELFPSAPGNVRDRNVQTFIDDLRAMKENAADTELQGHIDALKDQSFDIHNPLMRLEGRRQTLQEVMQLYREKKDSKKLSPIRFLSYIRTAESTMYDARIKKLQTIMATADRGPAAHALHSEIQAKTYSYHEPSKMPFFLLLWSNIKLKAFVGSVAATSTKPKVKS